MESTYTIRIDAFEGPFDLLLFFIERDELDIYDIPIAKITVAELIQLGILEPSNGDLLQGGVEPGSKALIVDLPSPGANQEPDILYVVGLQNFLSIVNYNRSYFYAQSVAEFAQALGYQNKSALGREQTEKPSPVPTSKNRSTTAKASKKDGKAKKLSKPPKPNN